MKVGVLALQGCVDPHCKMLESIGAQPLRVRSAAQLETIDRIILPGGESTTMLRLLEKTQMTSALRDFGRTHPVWGICAGSILIAREVHDPEQNSLDLIPIRARRNYYGSQTESFKVSLHVEPFALPLEADFIRAPLLEPMSREVKVLARHGDQAVLMQLGKILAASFHVELGSDTRLHEYFLKI